MSRRRPPVATRLVAVPFVAPLLGAAAAEPAASPPWLVVGLVFFGVAAVVLLCAVGVKMRRTPGPPSERPPVDGPPVDGDAPGPDADQGPTGRRDPDEDAAR